VISARIARRYAKALLAIGREDGQAEKYKEERKFLMYKDIH